LYIKSILEQYLRNISEFDLPPLNLSEQNQETLPKLIQEELSINKNDLEKI
ncbi:15079_t:CDS:1, partial [Gigaspora margarita]